MPLPLSRRRFLASTAATGAALALPGLSRAGARPAITHGVQTGDVAHDGAVIWARADKPSAMAVEWSTTEGFRMAHRVPALALTSATDLSGKMVLSGLPSDQDIFYRVTMIDLADAKAASAPVAGRFRTAPTTARDVSFLWSGDTAGQGWGIDESRGGMGIYETMRGHRPDFFIHSGDTVYADGPLKPEAEMPNGEIWRNLMTEEKSKVAETLHEFRHQWLYNMMDSHVRAFNAEAPVYVQWDDHEVVNNWYPGEILDDDRYTERNVDVLAANSARAFHEMNPIRTSPEEPNRVYRKVAYGPHLDIFFLDMRTYRGPNSRNDQPEGAPFLGAEQMAWLKRGLANSTATWKIMAADMPIGMMVRDGDAHFENMANGDGPPLGREQDIAELLRFMQAAAIRNVVWLTADVHYTAAHHYSPDRAQFQDFDPFWEFVSGPLHAGSFGPSQYDDTFGPRVEFARHPTAAQGPNQPPSAGLQFFGKVDIEGATGVMTVRLMDRADEALWSKTLEPARAN